MNEESKLMSVVIDWLKYDENNGITPAFCQIFDPQQEHSIQLVATPGMQV